MKVIVETETRLGSGTITKVYIPENGAEFATDEALTEAMRNLWKAECDYYDKEIEDSEFHEDNAHVYFNGGSIIWEIVKVETVKEV